MLRGTERALMTKQSITPIFVQLNVFLLLVILQQSLQSSHTVSLKHRGGKEKHFPSKTSREFSHMRWNVNRECFVGKCLAFEGKLIDIFIVPQSQSCVYEA